MRKRSAEKFTVERDEVGFISCSVLHVLHRYFGVALSWHLNYCVSAEINCSERSTSVHVPSAPETGLNCPDVVAIQCEITLPVGFDQVSAGLSCQPAAAAASRDEADLV